jgi:DNA-directed RNA polymerase beta' subunit
LSKRKTREELEFIKSFKQKSPVIDSDCTMNNICRYIESIDFGIRRIINDNTNEEIYKDLMSGYVNDFDNNICKKIVKVINEFKNLSHDLASTSETSNRSDVDEEVEANIEISYTELETSLSSICSNIIELVDYLIYIFYFRNKGLNKETLWKIYGNYIVDNLINKNDKIALPFHDENGEIEYLNKKYTLREVLL